LMCDRMSRNAYRPLSQQVEKEEEEEEAGISSRRRRHIICHMHVTNRISAVVKARARGTCQGDTEQTRREDEEEQAALTVHRYIP
jgi:hypothetical protein